MAFNKQKALDKAEKYAAKGQHDKAAREYQAVAENEPDDVRARLMFADCLVRCDDKAAAVENYLRVAATYAEQREVQKAIAVYRQVLNLDPSRVDVHFQVAVFNRAIDRVVEAVQGFEYVAHVQMQAGNVTDALECYRLAAEADPEAVAKRLRLAELYSREGKADLAVESFRIAAHFLLDRGRMEDFLRVGERLIYHRKDDLPMLRALAGAYLRLGDPRRALMRLNALLHAAPNDFEGLELLTDTFAALDKPDKAVSVILELVREIRGQGGPHQGQMLRRVVRKGLRWDPQHEDLNRLAKELDLGADERSSDAVEVLTDDEPAPELEGADDLMSDEIEELDLEDSEMLEISESDAVRDDQPAAPAPETADPDMPEPAERLEGVDRIVYEANVYTKYRLFDHALEHVQTALDQDPNHLDALRLRADALKELGRGVEAAMTFVEMARLVEPSQARELLAQALAANPGDPAATDLLGAVGSASSSTLSVEPEVAAPIATDEFDISLESTAIPLDPSESTVGRAERAQIADFLTDELNLDELVDLEPDEEFSEETREFGAPASLDEDITVQRGGSTPDEDDEFAIELQEQDQPSHSDVPVSVEDRFGLSEPNPQPESASKVAEREKTESRATGEPAQAEQPPPGGWPDIADEVAEIHFFLDQGLDDDARFAYEDLRRRIPGHPELVALAGKLPSSAPHPPPTSAGEVSPPHVPPVLRTEPILGEPGSGSISPSALVSAEDDADKPLVSLWEEDDEDAYLAAIFSDSSAPAKKGPVQISAHAEVEDADAQTHFDLGTAYREMGLVDDAIAQFERAAKDKRWRSKSLVMLGTLRVHRGETSAAIEELREAIASAGTKDELSEARYELGLVLAKAGAIEAAITELEQVPSGFRERNERLSDLRAGAAD